MEKIHHKAYSGRREKHQGSVLPGLCVLRGAGLASLCLVVLALGLHCALVPAASYAVQPGSTSQPARSASSGPADSQHAGSATDAQHGGDAAVNQGGSGHAIVRRARNRSVVPLPVARRQVGNSRNHPQATTGPTLHPRLAGIATSRAHVGLSQGRPGSARLPFRTVSAARPPASVSTNLPRRRTNQAIVGGALLPVRSRGGMINGISMSRRR